jgi:beta-ring hydroxylase
MLQFELGLLLFCRDNIISKIRRIVAKAGPAGRSLSLALANYERDLKIEGAKNLPIASGDVSKIVDQPFFVPLYALFKTYGGIFRLSFGPKVHFS